LEISNIHLAGFEVGLLFRPLLGFPASEFLKQAGRAGSTAESFNVMALTVVLLDAVLVGKSGRLRNAKAAGVRSDIEDRKLRRRGCRS
jgi:hypothetical protein